MVDKPESFQQIASVMADRVVSQMGNGTADVEKAHAALQDLKIEVTKKAAELCDLDTSQETVMDLVWTLAGKMPDFSAAALTAQGLSWLSLAMAILTGWLVGGIISGLLGFFSMGGDILRPLGIFIVVYLEQYITFNPAAARKFLKIFGWIGLAGFAARAGMGLVRFGTGFRNLFARGSGFFKNIWLLMGMLLIMAFFSSKRARLDPDKLKTSLDREILERLRFLCAVFTEWKENQAILANLRNRIADNRKKTGDGQILVEAVIQVMGDLDEPVRKFLQEKLRQEGVDIEAARSDSLIWDGNLHGALYEAQGFIKDGDHAIVLRKPIRRNGVTIKGAVARKA